MSETAMSNRGGENTVFDNGAVRTRIPPSEIHRHLMERDYSRMEG